MMTVTKEEVQALTEAMHLAQRELNGFTQAVKAEKEVLIRDYTEKVEAQLRQKYGDAQRDLTAAADAALSVVTEARITFAKQELERFPKGVLVEWETPSKFSSRPEPYVQTGRRGMMEVCSPATTFRENGQYNRPRVGDIFLRLLKKDGTPSLNFENLNYTGQLGSRWIPEGEVHPRAQQKDKTNA